MRNIASKNTVTAPISAGNESVKGVRLLPALLALLLASLFSFASCTGGRDDLPLLSILSSNRMVVLLKGTYATDNPLSRSDINGNSLFVDADDTTDLTGVPSYSSLPIYIDIGEIRLSTKSFLDPLINVNTQDKVEDFWDVVSTDRQVYCSQPYSWDSSYDSCADTGGIVNFIEFFNGKGAVYPSRDVGPGTYLHAGVYLRSIVTGFGRVNGATSFTKFDDNDVAGVNIMTRVNYDPGLTVLERQALMPQFFPLHHMVTWGQQTSMVVDHGNTPVVLEIRFNLLENLMVHSYLNSSSNYQTVVAFSDWRKAHAEEYDLGGNVLTRARIFYPEFTNELKISGGTTSTRHYYALYILNECLDSFGNVVCNREDWLPLAATPVRNGTNSLKDISTGYYTLQCRYDANNDGYPETVLGETNFEVGVGPGVRNIACACGASTSGGCL